MTNVEKVGMALSEWGFKVASSVLPKVSIPIESPVGKFMYGILGVDPRTYNIWNELGFLAEPLVQSYVTPLVNKFMAGMSDEQVEDLAFKFADSFIKRAEEQEYIDLFGIKLGKNAFDDLKVILTQKFEL